jgi:hypothetical protein
MTVAPPHWDSCGGFSWKVRFFITEGPGAAGTPLTTRTSESWVLQHFQRREAYSGCDGTRVDPTPADYWEAWRIGRDGWALDDYSYTFVPSQGPRPITGGRDDEFKWPNQPATWGHWRIDADAYWVEQIPVGYMSSLLPHPGAGDVPHDAEPPAGLDPGNWGLSRWVSTRWNCCEDSREGFPPGQWIGRAVVVNEADSYEEWWRNNRREHRVVHGREI